MSGLLKDVGTVGGGVLRVAAIVAPIPLHAIRLTAPMVLLTTAAGGALWGGAPLVGGALNGLRGLGWR